MSLGFCSRCWNYVDFCDCVNFDYSCEDDYDASIPASPQDPAPEVGTVWYFLVPIKDLSLFFESNGVEKVGLSLLLMQESLWTIAPPPGDESLYLSVPVDRLPERDRGLVNGTQYKYLNPWEFNYFNYNGPPIDKIVSLAAQLQQCNSKRTPAGRKACKLIKLMKSFFESFKVEDVPVPPGLEEAVLKLTGVLTPEQMLLLLTTLIPIELLQELNKNTVTAIDYDWVHTHLMNTLDPDLGYEDKKPPYRECFKENDIFCQHGSYPFPPPSVSDDMGDPVERNDQRPTKPDCGQWCQYLKNPRIITNHGNRPDYAAKLGYPDPVTGIQPQVPKWVQDLINAELAKGASGQVKNPPPGPPESMEVDDPKEIILEGHRNVLRERGGLYTMKSADTGPNAGIWFVAKYHEGVKLPDDVHASIVKARTALGINSGSNFPPEIKLDWKPREFSSRSAQRTVVPVFEDIILYDSDEDQDNFVSRPILPSINVRSPATSLLYNIIAINPSLFYDTFPVCVNVLDLQGINQTQGFDRTVLVHTIRPDKSVETLVDTQLVGGECTVVFVSAVPAGLVGRTQTQNYTFTLLSGTDNGLVVGVQGSTQNTVIAPGGIGSSGSTGFFVTAVVADAHVTYRTCTIRNLNTVNPTRSVWRITQSAGFAILNPNSTRVLLRDTPFTPPFNSFTNNGFVNASGLNPGIEYVSLPFSCRPQYQIPIGLQLYNETNMKAYSPNSRVTPGTLGYALGQSGNVGNTLAGSYYLPFNPTGVTAVTNYDITVQRSQGQMLLQALLTFGL